MQQFVSDFPIWQFSPGSNNPIRLPKALWEIQQAPLEIFVQGNQKALDLLLRLPEDGLAIVGTRKPQPRSLALVEKEIQNLAGTRLIVLSGLARGIDATAHGSALRQGLPTIAFLGTGLGLNYPSCNLRLREEILTAGGLIVSEFPFQMPGFAHQFLQRNRLIAGWSKATWVVEAGVRSGALNTARWAREMDRDCYTVPCFPGDPALSGNQILLDRDHAQAYWGVHSLGSTWLDLAARSQSGKQPKNSRNPKHQELLQFGLPPLSLQNLTDAQALTQQIKVWTFDKGGTEIQELLDWAVSRKWSPGRFFLAFQEATQEGWVVDRSGTVIGI